MKLTQEQLILKNDNRCIQCGCKLNGVTYSTYFEENTSIKKFKSCLCIHCLASCKKLDYT